MSARELLKLAPVAGTCAALFCASVVSAQSCNNAGGPDVIVGDIQGIQNWTNSGTTDAFSIATYSCNIGNANLNWISGTNQHPVIPQNMFRYKVVNGAGQFEHIGQSWMKHGFTALTDNLCCTCSGVGGSVLGVGCADPYTASRNGSWNSPGGLGPKFQVNAHTGGYIYPYMFRNNTTYIPHTSVTRRLQVANADLNPALNSGALYYVEAQYVTPDDAAAQKQDNNASYRAVVIGGAEPNYSGSLAGSTQRMKPAIRAWPVLDPAVAMTDISTAEQTSGDLTGSAILGAKATSLGGGQWHYEYAIHNLNSDRSFSSFSVPSSPGLVVTNIGFHDVPYHSGDGFNSAPGAVVTFDGTDWTGANDGSTMQWNMVPASPVGNSNALRWGTMYNFRFDCNSGPVNGNVTLGYYKAVVGLPNTQAVASVFPGPVEPNCPTDVDSSGATDIDDLLAVVNNWGTANALADVDDDGDVDIDDLLAVINGWGPCKA